MTSDQFRIEIKPAEESQLDLLHQVFSPHKLSKEQHKRYAIQARGEGLFLIAWHEDIPVGHFVLLWSGPQDAPVMQRVDITRSAYLMAGLTRDEFRRKGVATRLIREGERLARERGCNQIGLEVGSTDNPDAKRLYERLGYVDWGHGEFRISWDYTDLNGIQGEESEIVTYMDKPLSP